MIGGACLCGSVRMTAVGEPAGVAACHCTACRKHSGAPCAVFVDYRIEQISLSGVSLTLYESSPGVRRGFCGICGSTISYQGDNLPDMIHLHIGLFDDPARFQPQVQENKDGKLPWLHISTSNPRNPT